MKWMIELCKRPYEVSGKRWKGILISSSIVFFILLLLQPFGLSNIKEDRFLIISEFWLVTLIFMCIPVYVLPALFRSFYKKKDWTVGKQILNTVLIVFFISVGNWLYISMLNDWNLDRKVFGIFIFYTLIISIFPISYMTILRQKKQLSQGLAEVTKMNEMIKKKEESSTPSSPVISLIGSTKESVSFALDKLLFIEVEGNYIKVNYEVDGKVTTSMLRTTIKLIEKEFYPYPTIARCHRAFLINLSKVKKVSGNSQGYRLSLKDIKEEIPVSRSYAKAIREQLEELNT